MPEHFLLNFFSLGGLLPALFLLFPALLIFGIKKKSRATLWLGFALIFNFLFYIQYFPAHSFYDSRFVFHRWLTVGFILPAGLCYAQFFLHFPERTHPRLARWLLIIQAVIALLATLVFFYITLLSDRVYHFDGHYWDFDADNASRGIGIIILSFGIVVYILGYWRTITQPGIRWTAFGMTTGFLLATLVPAITNIMSREGLLDRGFHQINIDVFVISGFFLLVISFINGTRDRTSFMAKIISVCLALFLLVFIPISLFSLNDREEAYDKLQFQATRLAVDTGTRPADLRYLRHYNLKSNQIQFTYQAPHDEVIHPSTSQADFKFAALRLQLQDLAEAANTNPMEAALRDTRFATILSRAPAYFQPHAVWMQLAYDAAQDDPRSNPVMVALQASDDRFNRIRWARKKIKKMPDHDFSNHLRKFIESGRGASIAPLYQALSALPPIPAQTNLKSSQKIRARALLYTTPFRKAGARFYHMAHRGKADPYLGYMYLSTDGKSVYEAGYSYLIYRNYIHKAAFKLFIICIILVAVVLLGFRIFFYGALLRPINQLLVGVGEVNAGRLQVELSVHTEDEIGYVTHHFNKMVASIRSAQHKLKEYAGSLEQMVSERTAELENTLKTVQDLKQQQDGDYFLTALLTRPLGINHAHSDRVHIEFYLDQKKKFEYRERKDEIGGDMCSAHRITLRGRAYIVFFNADAMGKSIQGAGGTLVLGSVFEAMVNRYMASISNQQIYPERWLKNAFIELHQVMESFDGSMLISIVLGIIDEDNGFLSYINAEHPSSVLFRQGEASFLDEDMQCRKLGTQGMDGTIYVRTIQLKTGDVFLAGSDGRDDLLIGRTTAGERIINENEFLFLDTVRETKANLEEIVEKLNGLGELTDDLSLLRLEYSGLDNPPDHAATQQTLLEIRKALGQKKSEKALRLLKSLPAPEKLSIPQRRDVALAFNRIKETQRALAYANNYIAHNPADLEMIYRTSIMHKKLRQLGDAADLAERVRLRQPENIDNLVHLADIYLSSQNMTRATQMLELARDRHAEHPGIRLIEEHLNHKQ